MSRGIIFSAPMIRALLAGKKTQTRRIVKWEESPRGGLKLVRLIGTNQCIYLDDELGLTWSPFSGSGLLPWPAARMREICPWGGIGSLVPVREAIELCARAGDSTGSPWEHDDDVEHDLAMYSADGTTTVLDTWPWKVTKLSPIFLPAGLVRMKLKLVAEPTVERLQNIEEDDAKAEGIDGPSSAHGWPEGFGSWSHKGNLITGRPWAHKYLQQWTTLHGSDSVHENPWVWTLEFEVQHVEGVSRCA